MEPRSFASQRDCYVELEGGVRRSACHPDERAETDLKFLSRAEFSCEIQGWPDPVILLGERG